MTGDPTQIRAWQRFSDRITTSGMVQDKDLPELAALGVTRVIDLTALEHPEALPGEAATLSRLGISYHHLPVSFENLTQEDYAHFVQLFEASDEVTHVHCVANWRVSCFFYRYHLELGMAEEDARALMRVQWEPDASDHSLAAPWKAFVLNAKAAAADEADTLAPIAMPRINAES